MKKRVLFVTTDYSSFTQPVLRALKELGYETKFFDYYKPSFFAKILGLLGNNAIFSSSWVKKQIKHITQEQLKKITYSWNPNYLLVIKGETISKETIKEIKQNGVITINWFSDWLVFRNWLYENTSSYSIFFCVCQDTVEKLKKKNIKAFYLPVATSSDCQWKKHHKHYNISFVGQYSKRRERYFKEISDLGFTIWGYNAWQKSKLSHIANPPVSSAETLEIIRKSKIVVNTLTGSDRFEPNQVNFRAFETTGVGTFFLTLDAPMFHKHFDVGKEVVTFKTPSDLRKKAIYFLQNGKEREKIAKAGWYRTKKDHSFEKRLKQLFALANKEVK